jgi:hypothetical protein
MAGDINSDARPPAPPAIASRRVSSMTFLPIHALFSCALRDNTRVTCCRHPRATAMPLSRKVLASRCFASRASVSLEGSQAAMLQVLWRKRHKKFERRGPTLLGCPTKKVTDTQ